MSQDGMSQWVFQDGMAELHCLVFVPAPEVAQCPLHHYHTPAHTPWEQIQNWPSAEVMPNHTIGRVHWEGDTETALESSIFSTEEIHSFGTPDFYYLPWSNLFPIRCDIKSLKWPKFECLMKRWRERFIYYLLHLSTPHDAHSFLPLRIRAWDPGQSMGIGVGCKNYRAGSL